MSNDSTIPSQLGPIDTMPSQLGPATGMSRHPRRAKGSVWPGYLLMAGFAALSFYLLGQFIDR
jgi:hypothetical protein